MHPYIGHVVGMSLRVFQPGWEIIFCNTDKSHVVFYKLRHNDTWFTRSFGITQPYYIGT